MTTKAMPLSAGVCSRNCVNASSPPAEAPMPTMRKVRSADGLLFVDAAGADLAAARAGRRFQDWVGVDFFKVRRGRAKPFPENIGSGFALRKSNDLRRVEPAGAHHSSSLSTGLHPIAGASR